MSTNRHLSRAIVLQTLFEWDFVKKENSKIDEILFYNMKEFSAGLCDLEFAKCLVNNILEKKSIIDNIIEKAAPQWPIDKISIVDRNILRIGVFELLFSDKKEVPSKVAINEGIELAKTYGGESSGRFVSGVLGTIYKELGEPDEVSVKKKKSIKDIPYNQIPIEKKCGAVVYSIHQGDIYVGLVHDIFGHWTFSKGGIEEGEKESECIKRVIKKEMGVNVEVEDKLGDNEYIAYDPEKGKIRRQVSYFLARSDYKTLVLKEGGDLGGLDQAKWFNLDKTMGLNFYNDTISIITKAVEILNNK